MRAIILIVILFVVAIVIWAGFFHGLLSDVQATEDKAWVDNFVENWPVGETDISSSLTFGGNEGSDVELLWEDGKLNVIYDANKCTESAKMFLECLSDYINPYIEDKAKEYAELERLK